ncbi:hypothetical protein L208DRAFT_1518627 [Tricholoma matsutake]|nr:hypothetical protein L208DRAFT_1518627 [Tricholoma matsutake 945]
MDVEEPQIDPPTPTATQSRPEVLPTQSGRRRFLLNCFEDFVPSSHTAVPHVPEPVRDRNPPAGTHSPSPSPSPLVHTPEPILFRTECDNFGLYREYITFPTTDPEADQDLDDIYDIPGKPSTESGQHWWTGVGAMFNAATENIYHPFLNATVCRLMNWLYSGSNQKSIVELDRLVKEVLIQDDFDVSDLKGFSAARELRCLDTMEDEAAFSGEAGWKESSVKIRLPVDKQKLKEAVAPTFEIPGVWHRDLLEVICTAFEDTKTQFYHLTPLRLFWKPTPDSKPERVVTDLYNSDAFLQEHEKLQQQPSEMGCDLEWVVAAIMVWSDSTHLANFGQASLWPIYLFLGNQSKYQHTKPSQFAVHHLVYIPSV